MSWGTPGTFSSHISCSLTDPCEDLLALHGRHWAFANTLEWPVDAGRISVFSARNTRLRSHPQSEVYCWVMSGILLFASSCDDGLLLGFPHSLPFCRICSRTVASQHFGEWITPPQADSWPFFLNPRTLQRSTLAHVSQLSSCRRSLCLAQRADGLFMAGTGHNLSACMNAGWTYIGTGHWMRKPGYAGFDQ